METADWLQWLLYLLLGVGLEGRALLNSNKGDTLSEVLRYILGFSKRVDPEKSCVVLCRTGFYGSLIWFAGHIPGWW